MAKLVQLSEEAYRRLRGLKRRDESFSDVVLRILPRRSLRELAGLRSPKEIAEHQRWLQELDKLDR
jgi:predicted CopG family antitoxin